MTDLPIHSPDQPSPAPDLNDGSETKKMITPITMAFIGMAILVFMFISMLYLSTGFAAQIGAFLPDSFAPRAGEIRGTDWDQQHAQKSFETEVIGTSLQAAPLQVAPASSVDQANDSR